MRKLIFMMLMVLIIAGLAPFMLPLKDGRPLLRFSDVALPKPPSLPEIALPEVLHTREAPVAASRRVEMYRWRDAEGIVHFEDSPPQGVAYETVRINPEINSMAAPRVPKPVEAPAPATAAAPTGQLGNPYSPEGVKSLMDQARGIEGVLQERHAQQQRALGM